jgi:hypothetical protein
LTLGCVGVSPAHADAATTTPNVNAQVSAFAIVLLRKGARRPPSDKRFAVRAM